MAVTEHISAQISLDDKYLKHEGKIYLSGTQALVRLPLIQRRRDRLAGLNTGGFISGYRGSPLGGYDLALSQMSDLLAQEDIVFQPGVNEDLAATAVWGSQQVHLSPQATKQGVFGIWYGKGPGVDRSGDVFKHANAAGSSQYGGVLCVIGDDHAAKSSTVPHQSDHACMSALMPMLYPSSIHEFVEMGLLGIEMSRYSGCWVGLKVIADTVETTSIVDVSTENRIFKHPTDFILPEGGLNLRWPDDRWTQDQRLQNYKGYAALAFARANRVDHIVFDSPSPKLGIIASGKAYEDVRQALQELELTQDEISEIGLRVYKVGMPWPLEPEGVRHFSQGLQEILVVEERREIIEHQIKQHLFNWQDQDKKYPRPKIIGKFDADGKPVLPLDRELTVGIVARAIADRLVDIPFNEGLKERIRQKLAYFEQRADIRKAHQSPVTRVPHFCSGCPHNTSTRVPEGSRAMAGIGCHFMAHWMDRRTGAFTQMGGEGVPWVGAQPFTNEKHIFTNLGDGTYFHSGLLAIRQSVAAGVNITYKILYNDAVAMTGGQEVDGQLSVAQITHQMVQEGVKTIYLLSDVPEKYQGDRDIAAGVIIEHRDAIDRVQEILREIPGCSVLIYEQTCAAEKRRRRKRGLMADPDQRIFIHPDICEGCGDCSQQSNCIAVEPLETEMGRKRQINQSSCNKDFSCLKGFCPSFVSVKGAKIRKTRAESLDLTETIFPDPAQFPDLRRPYNVLIAGVGGTGVLTVGAVLGMAAHLEDKAVMILDSAGLAQKGGAVMSHLRFARKADEITSPRIVTGGSDLLIAADNIVAVSSEGAALSQKGRTHAIVNDHLTPVSAFIRDRNTDFKQSAVHRQIAAFTKDQPDFINFHHIAEKITGDAIATNIMMVGYAYQKGLLPLSAMSIEQAITLNKVAVKANIQAFRLGRLLVSDPARIMGYLTNDQKGGQAMADLSLSDLIDTRTAHLYAYQGQELVDQFTHILEKWQNKLADQPAKELILRQIAHNLTKVLAYKDEYEIARLYTDPGFQAKLSAQFEGDLSLSLSLAPPLLSGWDKNLQRPKKRRMPGWLIFPMLKFISKLRGLRGTRWDIFGYHSERRAERAWRDNYIQMLDELLPAYGTQTEKIIEALITLPDMVRGYGPVKMSALAQAQAKQAELLDKLSGLTPDHPDQPHLDAAD